jgi:hypothetical protein
MDDRSKQSIMIDQSNRSATRVRAEAGKVCYDINVHQFCCGGLNFGTYYDKSPIIAYDGAAHPVFSMSAFTPSTVPGCRTPHVWLSNGESLYDALGREYSLLRTDPAADVTRPVEAARQRGVPLTVVDVDSRETVGLYTTKLVLSRPDQHIAWRGDACPKDSLALIDLIRGAGL